MNFEGFYDIYFDYVTCFLELKYSFFFQINDVGLAKNIYFQIISLNVPAAAIW